MTNAPATTPLSRRIENALREGRIPQALDLAKQHVRQDPGPSSQALLRKCYLRSAEGQVGRGAFRDAHAVLSEAEKLPCDDPSWWERLAELRADLGDHTRALQLIETVANPAARPRILGRLADRAIKEGSGGRAMIPDEFKTQFEIVRKAFADYEAGRDEPAREALSVVGLGSPFLEWKLLLRGLMAWSANDTTRALDNWSRLTPERLPAKLAAPIRFSVDKAFVQSLPPARMAEVSKQSQQLSGGISEGMQKLRKQLANPDTLPRALETARAVVPELMRVMPDMVPKLANVFYWTLVMSGEPEDSSRYLRIFGPPADDPSLFRHRALVMEATGSNNQAHQSWAKYEEWISKSPNRWPGAQADRARALIFERMGRLAQEWLEDEDDDDEMDFFFSMFSRNARRKTVPSKPLRPSAEECFRKAVELAPDWVKPALKLIEECTSDPEKSRSAMDDILRRFPNDLSVLQQAAAFYEKHDDPIKARECIRQALAASPLDRDLRTKVARFAMDDARRLVVAKDLDGALAALKEAASLGTENIQPAIHAVCAAMYVSRNQPDDAQKHMEALKSQPNGRLSTAYRLAVEGSRLKVKKKDLTPWHEAFEASLHSEIGGAEIASLLDAHAQYLDEPTRYRGHKTHQKKILDRILAATSDESRFSEADRVQVGLAFLRIGLWKPLNDLGAQNQYKFPANPYFVFFQAEAKVARSRAAQVSGRLAYMYSTVKRMMDESKSGLYQPLQILLDERLKKSPELNPWMNHRGYEDEW